MSNTTTPSVVAIGELLWDMLPDGRKPGGAPANFIYHVAQNGVRGTAVTAVGETNSGATSFHPRRQRRQRGRAGQRLSHRHHRRPAG